MTTMLLFLQSLLNSARRQIVQALYDAKLGEMEKTDENMEPAKEPVSFPLAESRI